MLPITDAKPCTARDRALIKEMDLGLLRSFRNLIAVAERGLHADFIGASEVIDSTIKLLNDGNTKRRLRASVYAIHNQLHLRMKSGDGQGAYQIASELPHVSFLYGRTPAICPWPPDDFPEIEKQSLRDTFAREYFDEYGVDLDAHQPVESRFRTMCQVTEETLQKIKSTDPETFLELHELISDIVIIESKTINAGSSFRTFGCIYLTALRPNQNWTAYLEHLVHEAAHHHLFIVWWKDKIIESECQELHRSPLRKEPRPLSAIFHAMFVLGRTINTIRLFQRDENYGAEVFNMSTQYNNAKNPDSFEEKFVDAARVIEEHAILTPIGQKLFESTRNMVSL